MAVEGAFGTVHVERVAQGDSGQCVHAVTIELRLQLWTPSRREGRATETDTHGQMHTIRTITCDMIHLCPKEPEVLLVCPCPTTSGLEVTVLRGGHSVTAVFVI